MANRIAYYIDSEGADEHALELGLFWLGRTIRHHRVRAAWLAVRSKDSLMEGILPRVLGEAQCRALAGDDEVIFNGAALNLFTSRRRGVVPSGPMLAVYPDGVLLRKIQALREVTDLLVLPWSRSDVTEWARASGAIAIPPHYPSDP